MSACMVMKYRLNEKKDQKGKHAGKTFLAFRAFCLDDPIMLGTSRGTLRMNQYYGITKEPDFTA